MAKYCAIYQCQLCGKPIQYGGAKDVPYEKLPELCAAIIKDQSLIGSIFYRAPMYIPCQCADGNCGMAAFAGFVKEGTLPKMLR